MGKKLIVGVGLILYFWDNAANNLLMLVVEETEPKPLIHKERGMRSIPFETMRPSDGSLKSTMQRCASEELGVDVREMEILDVYGPFSFFPEVEDFDIRTYYGVALYSGDINRVFEPTDRDVRIVGWMTAEDLLPQYLRRETAPVIEDFIRNFSYLFPLPA